MKLAEPLFLFMVSFWTKQCVDIFGVDYNETSINRGIDWTNDNYGGYGMSEKRVSTGYEVERSQRKRTLI